VAKHPSKPAPVLRAGAVFHYAYLWHREQLAGQVEGRKDRPVVALTIAVSDRDGRTHVLALPITHLRPDNDDHGVLLPPASKQALGLDDAPSWVVTTEAVRFAWPGADVRRAPGRKTPFYGYLSTKVLQAVVRSFLRNRARGETVSFGRYE
jgi:hypothetical protein